jgi:hypothetical protein
MTKIEKRLEEYARKTDTNGELKKLLLDASKNLKYQHSPHVEKNDTYNKITHIRLNEEQNKQLRLLGIKTNGTAITIENPNKEHEKTNALLQLATFALEAAANRMKDDHQNINSPKEFKMYITQLAPWMQSIINSHTVRNGCNEIEDFDFESFDNQPILKV